MKTIDSVDDIVKHLKINALNIGTFGSGKTYFSLTFPRVYAIFFAKGEEDTILCNPNLSKNLVGWDSLIPDSPEDTKRIFGDLKMGQSNGELHRCLAEAKQMYKDGKIDTLVIDTITHLTDYLWMYENAHNKKYNKDNELDTRGMYGDLHTQLIKLVNGNICAFPGNLIINCHEMMEDDNAMKDKVDKTTPIMPSIIGGFRDKIGGLISNVIYMSKTVDKTKPSGYRYDARTNKGQNRNAKSRLNLPEIIEDISYDKMKATIQKAIKEGNNVGK